MPASAADERLRQAVALVAAVVRERLREQGLAHGIAGAADRALLLTLRLPLGASDPAAAAAALGEELTAELRSLAADLLPCPPGRLWCPRCAASACEHSLVADPRQVFGGYGPTGLPRWLDLGQLLLERHHPRVAEIYDDDHRLVTQVDDATSLLGALLPAYRERFGELRLHGQVTAGWYRAPAEGGGRQRVAVTFQVISSGRGRRRRYLLHPVGAAAAGDVLGALYREHGRLPWREAQRWAEQTLRQIEAASRRPTPPPAAAIARRLEGLLHHLAERLERPWRSQQRRTAHGDERHHGGGRPTRAAVSDLRAAPPERVLFDARHDTFVVLGPRGRTHVFGDSGKLVTSVRYPAGTIDRRQQSGAWQAVAPQQAASLLARVEALLEAAGNPD